MPFRTLTVDGAAWRVRPSGEITVNRKDEFSLIFSRTDTATREMRAVRYSPQGARTRDESFALLSDDKLVELFRQSQPSDTSPELFYAR
jgi:hypothetical protein